MSSKNDTTNRKKPQSAATLRRNIHTHLIDLGFTKDGHGYFVEGELSKQKIRDLHAVHRHDIVAQHRDFVEAEWSDLSHWFSTGKTLNPEAIDPELVEVKAGSQESRLFRLASLLWSIPVSQGFGRRLRFLVRDRQNGCLIGMFALGDPVFNLTARDSWIGWTHQDRSDRLVHVMDAYVAGAVPPYSHVISGKLVAALMASKEVKAAYERKYLGKRAIISEAENRARLVLLTTTSALGRSSMYNRLALPGGVKFHHLGATRGFGHFHLSGRIFESLRTHLEDVGHPYASGHRFGMGPNWKIRVIRAALESIGFEGGGSILKHTIPREVYAVPLATNWKEVLLGEHKNTRSCVQPANEIASYCLQRWILPRAKRDKRYKRFARRRIIDALLNGGPGPEW
ncbi:MAG TPA: Druantia anti-phage system protein DruA [Gemmatimonadales bacterium]|nr:Druantia anti-phage system protein DruA [Gemmatimonadales bacterium]